MVIERKVEEKWTCDECGKEISGKDTAMLLEVVIKRAKGFGFQRKVYVFCDQDHLNTWWKKRTTENLI